MGDRGERRLIIYEYDGRIGRDNGQGWWIGTGGWQ
jgi:hypothetical protein